MRLIVEQEQLSSNLSLVSRAIPSRPSHPILSNILVKADADTQQLSLTAFDLSMGINASFPAQVQQGGVLTLPAKLLNDIVSRLPGGDIEVNDEDTEAVVTLTSSSGRYQVRGMVAEEYPDLPSVQGEHSIQLAADSLLEGLKGTLFATSPDETKQVLAGVNLKVGKDTLCFASTDGHRLAVVKVENVRDPNSEEQEDLEITIPARALREVERMIVSANSGRHSTATEEEATTPLMVTLGFDDTQVVFDVGTRRLNSRKLEGAYPAYEQLIPNKFLSQVNVERRTLLGALERIGVLASQKNDIVKCIIDEVNQQISLSVEAADVGNALESMPAQISGEEPKELAFNVKYLMDGLKVLNSSEIQIQLNAASTPVIINPLGGLKMTYLVMPIQLRR
ncbi:DNA polymerase III subunit beta [Arthrospira sp. PCC 8006]|uniref:DNA polymerase III subunit beta n=1 Tax=Arthrospira sp. PCC 8006 TaxID=1982224 RepID=UPI00396F14B8